MSVNAIKYRTCPFIFICDVSKSMSGNPIKILNSVLKKLLGKFADLNGSNAHVKIKVAIMTFSAVSTWVSGGVLRDPEEYKISFKDLQPDTFTFMGKMFESLNAALSFENGLFRNEFDNTPPIIMLFSDGKSTDEFAKSLEALKNNEIYQKSIKLAVGYGESYDEKLLKSFINDAEEQFFTKIGREEEAKLEELIDAIASSSVASLAQVNSSPGHKTTTKENVAKEIREAVAPPPVPGGYGLGDDDDEDDEFVAREPVTKTNRIPWNIDDEFVAD